MSKSEIREPRPDNFVQSGASMGSEKSYLTEDLKTIKTGTYEESLKSFDRVLKKRRFL